MNTFKKPSDEELRQRLSSEQYKQGFRLTESEVSRLRCKIRRFCTPSESPDKVTQQEGTEPPFRNEYWDNKQPGIYVDIVSGEVLFSSLDKYETGTGWPSFTKPLAPENIVTHTDHKFFMARTEVRSKNADSHLGHVFDDGPPPTRKRYCMNSAALRFISVDELETEGYGQHLTLFGI